MTLLIYRRSVDTTSSGFEPLAIFLNFPSGSSPDSTYLTLPCASPLVKLVPWRSRLLTFSFCSFIFQFLGNTEVSEPKGILVVKESIRKLKFSQQLRKAEGNKTPKVELTISVDGVAIQDPKTKVVSSAVRSCGIFGSLFETLSCFSKLCTSIHCTEFRIVPTIKGKRSFSASLPKKQTRSSTSVLCLWATSWWVCHLGVTILL